MSDSLFIADETANGANPYLELESPFLTTPVFNDTEFKEDEAYFTDTETEFESPFLNTYQHQLDEEFHDPEEETRAILMDELFDEEFDNAVVDLVGEAERFLEDRQQQESRSHRAYNTGVEQLLNNHFEPLVAELEQEVEQMVTAMEKVDADSITEQELEHLLEGAVPAQEMENPAFEFFRKRFRRKMRRLHRRAKRLAKKGLKAIKRFSPTVIVLKRLKRLIRPFVQRVIQFALRRIPAQYRPLAQTLAMKLAGRFTREVDNQIDFLGSEDSDSEMLETEAVHDIARFQLELDQLIAFQFFADDEGELIETDNYLLDKETNEATLAEAEYEEAQKVLVSKLGDGVSETELVPLIENFISALLPVLRWGIRLIGRNKVKRKLAQLISKFIKPMIGTQAARTLSPVLVNQGFRLLNLETPEGEMEEVTHGIIVQALEETVEEITSLSNEVLDNDEILENYILESLETATGRNFPESTIQEQLRESFQGRGVWMRLPSRSRSRYKKYSRVFEVEIDHKKAQSIKSFGGQSLSGFLRNTMGIDLRKPVRVRIHLYEALRGSTLSSISLLERRTAGLGSVNRTAWMQFHPLTTRASGMLIGHPGLGKDFSKKWLTSRSRIAVRQRFYYLEIPGARPKSNSRSSGTITPIRRTEAKVKLDFLKANITLDLRIPETYAKNIVRRLKKNDYLSAAIALRRVFRRAMNNIKLRELDKNIRIVSEISSEELLMDHSIGGFLKTRLIDIILKSLVKLVGRLLGNMLRRVRNDFISAQENQARGITIRIVFVNVPIMSQARIILKARKLKDVNLGDILDLVTPALPTPDITIFPGRKNQ